MEKFFNKRNFLLFGCYLVLLVVNYIYTKKINNYMFTIAYPLVMIVAFLPIAMIEMNIAKAVNNKNLSMILKGHVTIVFVGVFIYLIAIIIMKLLNQI